MCICYCTCIPDVFGNELTLRSHLFDPNRHNPNVLPKKSSQPITINLSWLTATVAGFVSYHDTWTDTICKLFTNCLTY